jgi:hypothetical protein
MEFPGKLVGLWRWKPDPQREIGVDGELASVENWEKELENGRGG